MAGMMLHVRGASGRSQHASFVSVVAQDEEKTLG